MKEAMGIIYTTKDDLSLREMTMHRSVAALPVAGRYRIIDFLLSNMVNSGVRNVGVITQMNYSSLMDHLGSGKEWDLHTRNNGLFILPPYINNSTAGASGYGGLFDGLRANLDYLRRSQQDYVILSSSHTVYTTTYDDMLKQHIESGADITIMYGKARNDLYFSSSRSIPHAYLNVDKDGRVLDIEVNPNGANYDNLSLDLVIIRRALLIYLANQQLSRDSADMYSGLLRENILHGTLDVRGYEYKGYYTRVEAIRGYYHFNLGLLKSDRYEELFGKSPVYTKERNEVPTVYGANADVRSSLIADGCVINGTVENCVLFRGVKVGNGAVVRNSIIMQDCELGDNTELDCVILDKDVTVHTGGKLISSMHYPIVIGKNATV